MLMNKTMTRRDFIRDASLRTGGLALFLSSCMKNTKHKRPNIVLIIGDDISSDDFGCYGHPNIRTPHIDKLAANGLRFTNAYLTTSQCSPTRSSVITGRYPHNTGSPELHMELPQGQPLFPAALKSAGYYCVQAGKWHLGEYAKEAFHQVFEMEDAGPGGEARWIQCLQERPKEKPFFMWFASTDAHLPWRPEEGLPEHQPEDAIIPPYLMDTPKTRQNLANYYDEIQRLDHYVGQVMDELRQQGELENTCIIFMTDNGRPFPRCKTRLYDSGIKTPLIVHWPDGLRYTGDISHSLISVVDLAPTILEVAGLKQTEPIQGTSLVPVLNNRDTQIREYAFAEHNWHVQIAHERMVRWEDYVYIRNAHPHLPQVCTIEEQCPSRELRELFNSGNATPAQADPFITPRPAEELYLLPNDPHQIKNLANKVEYHDTLEHLRKIMDQWQDRTGDTVPPLDQATPDRHDRSTGKRFYAGSRPPTGVLPGQARGAMNINDPGPR